MCAQLHHHSLVEPQTHFPTSYLLMEEEPILPSNFSLPHTLVSTNSLIPLLLVTSQLLILQEVLRSRFSKLLTHKKDTP